MSSVRHRSALLAFVAALLLFAAPASAENPVSGSVTGEMRFGDHIIKLTHVYVMEPFIPSDAPPDRFKPQPLFGKSILPEPGSFPASEILMVLDNGEWRLMRN